LWQEKENEEKEQDKLAAMAILSQGDLKLLNFIRLGELTAYYPHIIEFLIDVIEESDEIGNVNILDTLKRLREAALQAKEETTTEPLDSSFQPQHEENLEKLSRALNKAIISLESQNNFGKDRKDEGLASSGLTRGGIDLNPDNLNMRTISSGLQFNLPLQTIRKFQASNGLTFQIMKIEKGVDLKSVLGIEEEEKEVSYLSH